MNWDIATISYTRSLTPIPNSEYSDKTNRIYKLLISMLKKILSFKFIISYNTRAVFGLELDMEKILYI